MRLYRVHDGYLGARWVDTKAEAESLTRDWKASPPTVPKMFPSIAGEPDYELREIPTDKAGLRDFLNELEACE